LFQRSIAANVYVVAIVVHQGCDDLKAFHVRKGRRGSERVIQPLHSFRGTFLHLLFQKRLLLKR
jgi:hypothetical protein